MKRSRLPVSSSNEQFLLSEAISLTSLDATICEGVMKNVVSYPALTSSPDILKSAAENGSWIVIWKVGLFESLL